MASSVKIDITEVRAIWLSAQVAVPQEVYLEDHGTLYLWMIMAVSKQGYTYLK